MVRLQGLQPRPGGKCVIVHYKRDEVLVDREALAMLTKRSVHTIRLRCDVVRYYRGRALYALEREVERLGHIPTRHRDEEKRAS